MPRRDYEGNAIPTTLANSINSTDLIINISAFTGWPSGGANGKFYVTIDRGLSTEERVLISSRTAGALTVASVGDRGVDGTAAAGHASGAKIEHTYSGVDADEANEHVNDTSKDHHTQYINNARHDITARHAFGAALGTPPAPADIGTGASAGVGTAPARSDHVHKIGAGAINSAGMFAPGIVDAAAIGADQVGTSEIAPLAVTAAELAADAVVTAKIQDDAVTANKAADGIIDALAKFAAGIRPYYTQAGDPGAVGNGIIWFDTTNRQIKVRNAGNSGWDLFGEVVIPWTDYTPTFASVSLGGGTRYGRYTKIGKTCVVVGGFTLGGTGNVLGEIIATLPFSAKDVDVSGGGSVNRFTFLGAGWATDASASATFASIGTIDSSINDNEVRYFSTAGSTEWSTTIPFDWAPSDHFHFLCVFEAV